MDRDQAQMNHHGLLHHEKSFDDSTQPHMTMCNPLLEQKSVNREADLDALEARLFAMAGSRS